MNQTRRHVLEIAHTLPRHFVKHGTAEFIDRHVICEQLHVKDGTRRFLSCRVRHSWPPKPEAFCADCSSS